MNEYIVKMSYLGTWVTQSVGWPTRFRLRLGSQGGIEPDIRLCTQPGICLGTLSPSPSLSKSKQIFKKLIKNVLLPSYTLLVTLKYLSTEFEKHAHSSIDIKQQRFVYMCIIYGDTYAPI